MVMVVNFCDSNLTLAPVNDDPTGTADASLIVGVEDTPYQVFEAEC